MPSEESNKQVLLCLAPRQLILKLTHIALVDRVGFINTICKNDPKCGNLSVPFKTSLSNQVWPSKTEYRELIFLAENWQSPDLFRQAKKCI